MQPINIRASARQDITNHYVYLAEHAGLAVAESFLTNAEPSFSDLAATGDGDDTADKNSRYHGYPQVAR